MPLRNRVTPFGEIVAPPPGSTARGDFFGNRGCLHDASGRLRRAWRSRAWITCLLAFKGRHRTLLQPGRYTELFFLDEATAFAAGHRPCGECRWHDYQRFRAHLPEFAGRPVQEVDAVLQRERVDAAGRQITEPCAIGPDTVGPDTIGPDTIGAVPDGCLVALPGAPARALLKWGAALYPWTLDGYGAAVPLQNRIIVLTPPTLRTVLARGYRLALHRSAPPTAWNG